MPVVGHSQVLTNGPFGYIKETIGGYYCKNGIGRRACGICQGVPVLQGEGNTVEVRKIAKGDGVQ